MVSSRPWAGGILGGHVLLQLLGLDRRSVRPCLNCHLCCCSCCSYSPLFLFLL